MYNIHYNTGNIQHYIILTIKVTLIGKFYNTYTITVINGSQENIVYN